MCPNVGFIPATPQNAAGRVMDPPVCVPRAARHIPQATAAAEPLDEPPGVRSRFHGLRVTGGSIQAKGVETVLPRMIAPALRKRATMEASIGSVLPSQPAIPHEVGRPLDIDDVLDPDRNPVQRPAVASGLQLGVALYCLGQGTVSVHDHPGPDLVLSLLDPIKARLEDVDAGGLALAEPPGRAGNRLVVIGKELHRSPFRADEAGPVLVPGWNFWRTLCTN